MICQNCGKDNKDTAKFCVACGTKLELEERITTDYIEKEATVVLKDYDSYKEDFESFFKNESDGNFDNRFNEILESDFENEETVILQDNSDYEQEEVTQDLSDFENEETVILQDNADYEVPFEDEHTVVLDGLLRSNSEVAESEIQADMPEVPKFQFEADIYKAPPTQFELDTAYINHLRALKQLMDDGIITEDEFTRKKKQILGI